MSSHKFNAAAFLLAAAATSFPLQAQTGFQARLLPPARDVAGLEPVRQYLAQTRMLETIADAVNAFVVLPRPVVVTGAECGVVNAFYHPQRHEIVMCYELVRDIIGRFRNRVPDAPTLEVAVIGATAFVLYHEVGHALVGELRLPITGREEDVADQFAAYMLGRQYPLHAVWAAQFWMERAGPGSGEHWTIPQSAFADEHGLDAQRFYNVMCWTYGISPGNRTGLLSYLPPARAQRCPQEAAQMVNGWNSLLGRHQRQGRPAAPQRPTVQRAPWINGNWSYTETIGQAGTAVHCVNQGTYAFNASGGAVGVGYGQTGQCVINGQRIDNPGQGTAQGTLAGGEVRFALDACSYAGRVDATGRRIVGAVTCRMDLGGGAVVDVPGTWQAWR
ncbi:MAG TPA: DUF4344 domain-containing metallopeptidase [Longimicrobium sp.]|jgi:hypothetical protein|nr:DUF4344 domain-containing metallopeptidase [Longimicrobium sp.]